MFRKEEGKPHMKLTAVVTDFNALESNHGSGFTRGELFGLFAP